MKGFRLGVSVARPGSLAATLVAATLVLTSCGGSGDSDKEESRLAEASTCADYVKMSDADKLAAYEGATGPGPVYLDDGVHAVSVVESYDLVCTQPGVADESPWNAAIALAGQCGVFIDLPPDVQDEWATAANTEADRPKDAPMSGSAFDTACRGFGTPSDILARVANTVSSCTGYASWQTESRLGYKTGLGICIHELQMGDEVAHPHDDDMSPGAGCAFEPTTDAVVPYTVYAMEQTEGDLSPSSVFAGYALQTNGTPATTTATVEAHYSDGPSCREPGKRNGVEWTLQDETSTRFNHRGFVILHDYLSPANPDGAAEDLSDWALASAPSKPNPDDGDEIVTAGSASIDFATKTADEGTNSDEAAGNELSAQVTKNVVWSDGYTGTAHYFVRDVVFGTNVENSPPEEARLEISFVAGGEYQDTTETRDSGPTEYGRFGAVALYDLDSAACRLEEESPIIGEGQRPALATVTFSNGAQYCKMTITSDRKVRSDSQPASLQHAVVTRDVDESALNDALASLRTPVAIALNQTIAMMDDDSECRFDLDGGINAIGSWVLETPVPGIPCTPTVADDEV